MRFALFSASLALLLAAIGPTQSLPSGFVVETLVSSGLAMPNDCCFLPDGRCLVANANGAVCLHASGSAVATTVGTVPNVESGGERGLLSIAADPAFASNGHLYVYYSSALDNYLHVDRFTCTGDLANAASTNLLFTAASRRVLLGTLPDNASNHNGGSLRFGPDGMLYVSVGDDANACAAQSLTSQVGCLLRLDVSQLAAGPSAALPAFSALDPGNNPLSANADFSQLVIAHGLRNPFRMEIDPLTGNIYLGDVGAGAVEEYDEYVHPNRGDLPLVNFGWPWREGNLAGSGSGGTQPAALVQPIATVAHGSGWAAVMGGARYRNRGGEHAFGPGYEGNTFFLDYFAGELRRLADRETWQLAAPVPGQPTANAWASGLSNVTSLRLGPDGALWFTQHAGTGTLRRIRPLGPVPSIAVVSGSGQRGPAGETFAQPLVVRVLDAQNNPLPRGQVHFTVTGAGMLSTTNPVIADADGIAQTTVTSTTGGALTVEASTPGAVASAQFALFGRRISTTVAGSLFVVSVNNQTNASPPQVPYIVMLSFPGSPTLPTLVGPLCIDPAFGLAVVIEDGVGPFGFVSFSGSGGMGSPSLTKLYPLPAGLFAGQLIKFQAVGVDPLTGWFRTNCETRQF